MTCRLWAGARNADGYGVLRRGGTVVYAHRVALEEKLGRRIRRDRETSHTCHVRHCIEPSHLREVTHRANMRLSAKDGRLCR